jgi:hypothetical protein
VETGAQGAREGCLAEDVGGPVGDGDGEEARADGDVLARLDPPAGGQRRQVDVLGGDPLQGIALFVFQVNDQGAVHRITAEHAAAVQRVALSVRPVHQEDGLGSGRRRHVAAVGMHPELIAGIGQAGERQPET